MMYSRRYLREHSKCVELERKLRAIKDIINGEPKKHNHDQNEGVTIAIKEREDSYGIGGTSN